MNMKANQISLFTLLCGIFVFLMGSSRSVSGEPESTSVTWYFTGWIHDNAPTLDAATVIICSNTRDSTLANPVSLTVELALTSGGYKVHSTTVSPTDTAVIATADVNAYGETHVFSGMGDFDAPSYGFVRVTADSEISLSRVLCTAQVIDPNVSPPTFVATLPMQRSADLGIPTSVGLSATGIQLASQPTWSVIGMSVLVLLSAAAHWRERHAEHVSASKRPGQYDPAFLQSD